MTATPLHARRTAVYQLFAADGALLYVGASCDPKGRLYRHRDRSWGAEIARMRVTWYPNRATALRREALAIYKKSPRYNRDRPGPDVLQRPKRPPAAGTDYAARSAMFARQLSNFDFTAAAA